MANNNVIQTIEIKVSTNRVLKGYLTELCYTGMYGKSEAEAAERLIADAIQKLVAEGVLKRRTQSDAEK